MSKEQEYDLTMKREDLLSKIDKLNQHVQSKLKTLTHANIIKTLEDLDKYRSEADETNVKLVEIWKDNDGALKLNNEIFTKLYLFASEARSSLVKAQDLIEEEIKKLDEESKRMRETLKRKFSTINNRVTDLEADLDAQDEEQELTLEKVIQFLSKLEREEKLTLDLLDKALELNLSSCDVSLECNMMLKRISSLQLKGLEYRTEIEKSNIPLQQNVSRQRYKQLAPPTFNSNDIEWTAFKALFQDFVKEERLTGKQKLQQLRESISGEALKLINLYELTDEGFKKAWEKLITRYENKRKLASIHLKTLVNLPVVLDDSAMNLRKAIDPFEQALSQLQILQPEIEKRYNLLAFFLLYMKLDKRTQEKYNETLDKEDLPEISELIEFIEDYAQSKAMDAEESQRSNQKRGKGGKFHASSHVSSSTSCNICSDSHFTYKCPELQKLDIDGRFKILSQKKLCNVCFRPTSKDHTTKTCKSRFSCKKCDGHHNPLLHREKKIQKKEKEENEGEASTLHLKVSSLISDEKDGNSQVLLPTAVVNVENGNGELKPIRALLDGGSQVNFISKRFAETLNLKRVKSANTLTITGVGGVQCGKTRGSVYLTLNSRHTKFSLQYVHCYVLPSITCIQPHEKVPEKRWSHLKDIKLADPQFHIPGKIDLLLGTDITYITQKSGKKIGGVGQLSAYETEFGWVVPGSVSCNSSPIISTHVCDLQNDLQRFWEQEILPGEDHIKSEGEFCEMHFTETHTRTPEGRYQVRLPFKPDSPPLGDSKGQAISRFKNLERKFEKNPEMKAEYVKAINQLIELGHVEVIPADEIKKSCTDSFYLPHHAVIKESSTSTKVRLVFDGSAATTTGVSLNQKLAVGDTIQPDLASILTVFRCYQIALCGDIKQMYHQVLVDERDKDYLRLVWRESPLEPLKELRFLKVVFGAASAPFLAIRATFQLVKDEGEKFPLASRALLKESYVDNIHGGKNTVKETIQLYRELDELTLKGGFKLCKWSSNSPDVLQVIPKEDCEISMPLSIGDPDTIKTLGVKWNPQEDVFSFSVTIPDGPVDTKRKILSHIARLYDPEGWFGPVIVTAKIIMQDIWKLNQGWDEKVPEKIQNQWEKYCINLRKIEEVKIPRKLLSPSPISVELHGFCDASGIAYGAVVYIRSKYTDGSILVNLVSAKSRVVPIKNPQTIPRLELMGAVVLAQLMQTILISMESVVEIQKCCHWSDSSAALHWINSSPERWKPFIANRVKKISELSDVKSWFHVPTKSNPADYLSRGKTPKNLQDFQSWWCPEFLNQPNIHFGEIPGSASSLRLVEEESRKKKEDSSSLLVTKNFWLFDRISTWNKLRRVVSYMLRFKHKRCSELTVVEIEEAEKRLVLLAQQQSFQFEIELLKNGKAVPKTSKIHKLYPFLDQHGILRVTGRLKNALIPDEEKHPMILCGNHPISKLMIRQSHLDLAHGGANLIRSILSEKYWIVQAKRAVNNVIHNCQVCHRLKLKAATQLMGQLPSCRIQPSPAFSSTGVDFAGPFFIKSGILPQSRGKAVTTIKVYVAVFVCMVTKAIHLELVLSLSTPAFLECLWRFISRRGRPAHIYSDNGGNFIGAAPELKEIQNFLENQESRKEIINQLALKKIQWHFIAPKAPHQGGLWEAGVKSMKHHLKRMMKDRVLAYSELETLIIQVEGILNSRPLCPMSSNPENFEALTPGHFLIGRALISPPQVDLTDLPENRLSKWQNIQALSQHLWKRWSKDYLSSLQQRPKWWKPESNLKIGELVIQMEDNSSPWEWNLGRIEEIHPGKDGKVRVVTIKTFSKDEKGQLSYHWYKRPITKIAQLPSSQENQDQLDNEAEAERSLSDN